MPNYTFYKIYSKHQTNTELYIGSTKDFEVRKKNTYGIVIQYLVLIIIQNYIPISVVMVELQSLILK